MDNETNSKIFIEILQWIKVILIAVIVAFLVRAFLFEPVVVRGSSMENTLSSNERLIISKLSYLLGEPQRGDIIVLKYMVGNESFFSRIFPPKNEVDYIKRIIGMPGDKIDIKNGEVYINDEKLSEDYVKGQTYARSNKMPAIVPENSYFVMGDNRENSNDSRTDSVGFISRERIKGKAVLRIWPFNKFNIIQ